MGDTHAVSEVVDGFATDFLPAVYKGIFVRFLRLAWRDLLPFFSSSTHLQARWTVRLWVEQQSGSRGWEQPQTRSRRPRVSGVRAEGPVGWNCVWVQQQQHRVRHVLASVPARCGLMWCYATRIALEATPSLACKLRAVSRMGENYHCALLSLCWPLVIRSVLCWFTRTKCYYLGLGQFKGSLWDVIS